MIFEDAERVYVVELKRSPPQNADGSRRISKDPVAIALPEVLHQAWMIGHRSSIREHLKIGSKMVVPVIISPHSGWLRASIAFLFEHGLRPDSLRYLEFEPLVHKSRKILWVGEPFTAWTAAEPPRQLQSAFDFAHWYSVADENAWFGVSRELTARPTFVEGRYVEAGLVEGTSGEYVACTGAYGDKQWTYSIVGSADEAGAVPERH